MGHYGDDEFRRRFGPWALVAGASDGTGEAYVREVARRGLNVVLLSRRAELLEEVAASVREEHGVETRTVVADLTSPEIGPTVLAAVAGLEVGLLVYNAGAVHAVKKFLERPLADAITLVDLNCRGPVTVAHALGSAMKDRKRGGMVFMSSMACLAGSSYTTTYAATKSFDTIFAEGLWHELQPEGIDVLSVIAGATDTPSMRNSNDLFADHPGLQDPSEVARGALDHLGAGPTFVPGETNRQGAAYMWPRSRVALSNMMSKAAAELYGLPHTDASGVDFHDAS